MSGFRRYGRKPYKCTVRIAHEGAGDIFAETLDVSETGVFIQSVDLRKNISLGDTVEAQMFSDETVSSNTQLKVVRMTMDGVGLAFE